MRITVSQDISNIDPDAEPAEVLRFLDQIIQQVMSALNSKLEFDINLRTQTVQVTFPVANQDVAVVHTLGKLGAKYFASSPSMAGSIYNGVTASTASAIYVRSSVAGMNAQIVVF